MPRIERNLTAINRTPGNSGREWIVVHNVGTPATYEGAAHANTRYFASGYRGASAHYFIDDGATIWQCVDGADTAWAVGDGASRNGCCNSNSISVEVCGDGEFSGARRDNLRWLVRRLMEAHGIDAAHVVRHCDVTGKACPARYAGEGNWAWDELHAYITIGEDMSASEVWNYPIGQDATPGLADQPAWQRLSWIHHDVAPLYAILTRTDDAGGLGPDSGANIYERVCALDSYCTQLAAQVPALVEAVRKLSEMQGADPDEVAQAVADAVAAKLETIDLNVTVG